MMDFDLSSLSDPSDFPTRFSFLRDVDRELRCAICAEFIDSAVTLPCCGVAYCSLCLRSALAAGEAICPNHFCRKPSCEASIRPVASINRIVAAWKQGRAQLLAISQAAESTKSNREIENKTDASIIEEKRKRSSIGANLATQNLNIVSASTSKEDSQVKLPVAQPLVEIGNLVKIPEPKIVGETSSPYDPLSDTTMTLSAQAQSFQPSNLPQTTDAILVEDIFDEKSANSSSDDDRCIVCNAKISPARMARHVEMHFAAEDRETRKRENDNSELKTRVSVGSRPDRKPLPKLNYHIMQIKEIKSRCDALKLSSVGKKDKLIQRHRTYTLLFNANLDSVNPKTDQQLRAEVTRRERIGEGGGVALGDSESSSSQAMLFGSTRDGQVDDNAVGQKINKKSKPEVVEKVMKDYESSHRDQFSDLIAKAKMSREGARGKRENPGKEEGAAIEGEIRGESSTHNVKDLGREIVPTPNRKESLGVERFWAEWDDRLSEEYRSKISESRGEVIEQPRSTSVASSTSPFPAEQTPIGSMEEMITPRPTEDDESEDVTQEEAVLTVLSHRPVTLSHSTPSPNEPDLETITQCSNSGRASAPPENEKDNYDEEAETLNTVVKDGSTEFPFQRPSEKVKRPSQGNKRSLSPLLESAYFSSSPSKRPRTTAPVASTTTTTATTTSSPDIDSQISYSVAHDVFAGVGDSRGSPVLFPSNENSLDGAEDHNSSISPVAPAPANITSNNSLTEAQTLPSAPQQLIPQDLDPSAMDINRNTKIAITMEDTDEEDIVCLDQDEDSLAQAGVLRLSKGSSFLHHSKSEFPERRSGHRENIAENSLESVQISKAISPPSSSVKSKPRNRKKVVPFAP